MHTREEVVKGWFKRAKTLDRELDMADENKSAEMLDSFILKFLNDVKNLEDVMNILNEEKKKNLNEILGSLLDIGLFIGLYTRNKTLLDVLIKKVEENVEVQQKLEEYKKSKFDLPYHG